MVSIASYKEFIIWFEEKKEQNFEFTISDVRRETTLAPQTINKILEKLVEKQSYVEVMGSGTNKKYKKLGDIDLDFFLK